MPIESRFDDLDLREEPLSGKSTGADGTFGCTATELCNSYNTCTTVYC